MHGDEYRRELENLGIVVNLALNNPDKLKSALQPKQFVTSDQLPPGPLRAPKDRTKRA